MTKRPKTTQERRAYIGHAEYARELSVDIRLRRKRSNRNLANAWDDRVQANVGHRSWKRQRRTQYKNKLTGNTMPQEDLKDIREAEKALIEFQKNDEAAIPLEEIRTEFCGKE